MVNICKQYHRTWWKVKKTIPTTWSADWDNFSAADHEELTLDPIEANHIFIKDNISSWKKLWDIWQRIIGYNKSSNKMETILIEYQRKVQSLDQPQKSQVFQRTTQTQ